MASQNVLDCDDIRAITGYRRPADAARCLRDQGVAVFDSRRGPWTTIDLINKAGGLSGQPAARLEADDIL